MTDYTDLGFDKNFTKIAGGDEPSNGGEAITVPDNSVTTEKIRDEAVTSNKIKDFNWSKGRGGIISVGGQDNLLGTISVNRSETGVTEETMVIDRGGISFPNYGYYAYANSSSSNVINANGPTNIDAHTIIGVGKPCYYLIILSVLIETTTWDATNYCEMGYYVNNGSTYVTGVSFGEIGNTTNLKNVKLRLSNQGIVHSGDGTMTLYTYKQRTGVTGSPTATITNRTLKVFSLFSPITLAGNMTRQ